MKPVEFKKLLKEDDPKHIIFRYTHSVYLENGIDNLTDKQLQKVIDLKNKKYRE